MVAVQPGDPQCQYTSDSDVMGSEEETAAEEEPTAIVEAAGEYEDEEGGEIDVMAEFARHSAKAVSAMGYDTGTEEPARAVPDTSSVALVPGWSIPAPAIPRPDLSPSAPTTP
jgi:hypothetical protein